MHISIDMLPDAIIEQYNLRPLLHNGYVYVEIRRGMYGLPHETTSSLHIWHRTVIVPFLSPLAYGVTTPRRASSSA
jgi:hypothetical protein